MLLPPTLGFGRSIRVHFHSPLRRTVIIQAYNKRHPHLQKETDEAYRYGCCANMRPWPFIPTVNIILLTLHNPQRHLTANIYRSVSCIIGPTEATPKRRVIERDDARRLNQKGRCTDNGLTQVPSCSGPSFGGGLGLHHGSSQGHTLFFSASFLVPGTSCNELLSTSRLVLRWFLLRLSRIRGAYPVGLRPNVQHS